ncbi:hypothetical protein NO2_1689, partial [Candidatus Termititenax persephonae]
RAAQQVRDYNSGKARFRKLEPTDTMYALVSRNNGLYIQRLENIVPGRIQGVDIDLSRFARLSGQPLGVAYQNKKQETQIVALPVADNYYVTQNVQPVFAQPLGKYTLLSVGLEPKFPDSLAYYNLRELIYANPDGRLIVYTDLEIEEVNLADYGQYELRSVRGWHMPEIAWQNFSPSRLKGAGEMFFWQAPREEENDGE